MSQRRPISSPEAIEELVGAILRTHAAGDGPAVARAATTLAGFGYRITREQRPGLVDCSSLVAQSHWFGAAVGTPFIAETQRRAYSATDVTGVTLRPGDVLVRWPSREAAPLGLHNHVGLHLGPDRDGTSWLLESAEEGGVRATPADPIAWARGGIRRFLPELGALDPLASEAGIALARGVPKLGRLGVRLTAGLLDPRRHRGIDVYVQQAARLRAPISGTLRFTDADGVGRGDVATIVGRDDVAVVGPVAPLDRSAEGDIEAGAPLGALGTAHQRGCNVLPMLRHLPHLHLECWTTTTLPFHPERDLVRDARRPALMAYNPLLAVRVGHWRSPLMGDAEVVDLWPRAPERLLPA
jgi:hypothetical protein